MHGASLSQNKRKDQAGHKVIPAFRTTIKSVGSLKKTPSPMFSVSRSLIIPVYLNQVIHSYSISLTAVKVADHK